ncbi:4-oxalmesaconate hydratase [Amycolatopsis bartoniae]|uniref:4-oxalomesaconate hydratase n=1 Tax=Amycolatopsis bartoniae TaxID=941986 RepID=A0A8H9IYY3_9PSEU|nr:amidohydrolase family protein [Amycolatopsis bartoniae]MBB2938399.1 4-oxalmesaconate hydratase [Amycolatopsis bartoniae]TVT06107.1 amidohydrolase [Amycolatopsis bartoniae]GHF71304.1 4-oxalomesaconate hydratase [Amycolatopsis bartoniae]
MIIDCHGHFTTAPPALGKWRERQIKAWEASRFRVLPNELFISDEEIIAAIEGGQLKLQRERGTDVTLFSPGAGKMAHHYGDARTSLHWSQVANDLIARVCGLFPDNFVGVCQLPQSPGDALESSVHASAAELERCVTELGFVGCLLNPDPSDGYWQAPPLTDRIYYPLYEKLVELDVPAMVHVAMSRNAAVQGTCAHYLNGDTAVFMQLCQSDLFTDFPALRLILPHGGGAVPYHWGRYRGVMLDQGRPPLEEALLHNVFFDTCVYHKRGLELLTDIVPAENILFASEMIGAVRSVDPETGRRFDDVKSILDSIEIGPQDRQAIYGGNALRVFPRLERVLHNRKQEEVVR